MNVFISSFPCNLCHKMMASSRDITRTIAVSIFIVIDFIAVSVRGAANADEEGLCFRAESLGHREGNLYYCTDPDLPVCCERDNTHTCCRTETDRSVSDQAILWGFVCLTVLSFALVYYYFTREGDYWESENIRLAANHMARRFGLNWFKRKNASDERLMKRGFDTMPERTQSATPSTSSASTCSRATGEENVNVTNSTSSHTGSTPIKHPL